jgi:hypothetical protein
MLKQVNIDKGYENFKWFFTSSNILVIGGKSDEQNEFVLKTFLKPNYTVMHTSAPGSPFMIIQSDKPSKKDLEETAIFTGCFSQQWKKGNQKIDIDVFRGDQIYKIKDMKIGTFGVRGEKKTMKIKPELILIIQKGKLRAVPDSNGDSVLAKIKPGKLSKEEAADKIAKKIRDIFDFPVSKEEIMSAIPSDKLDVK